MTAPGLPAFPGPTPYNMVTPNQVPVVYPYWDWNAPAYPFTSAEERPYYYGPRPVEIRRVRREAAEGRMSPPNASVPGPRVRHGRITPECHAAAGDCPPGWEQRGTYPSGRAACCPKKKRKGKKATHRGTRRNPAVGRKKKRKRGFVDRELDKVAKVVGNPNPNSARKHPRRRNLTGLLGLMQLLSGSNRRQARESTTSVSRRKRLR